MRTLIIVIGKVCTGKDYFAREVYPNAVKIDVGDIVRSITKKQQRTFICDLDKDIIQVLQTTIFNIETDQVIVTGIRQLTIYEALIQRFSNFEIRTYYLRCSEELAKLRFLEREAEKDRTMTYEQVVDFDNQLGLAELQVELMSRLDVHFLQTNKPYNASNIIQKSKQR